MCQIKNTACLLPWSIHWEISSAAGISMDFHYLSHIWDLVAETFKNMCHIRPYIQFIVLQHFFHLPAKTSLGPFSKGQTFKMGLHILMDFFHLCFPGIFNSSLCLLLHILNIVWLQSVCIEYSKEINTFSNKLTCDFYAIIVGD